MHRVTIAALIVASLSVTGCGQLFPAQDAAVPEVAAAPEPEPIEVAAPEIVLMPEFAPEIAAVVGQNFAVVYPTVVTTCLGSLDGIVGRYNGDRSGIKVVGWGYDLNENLPYSTFVAVDAAGLIQGGGTGNTPRPDVIGARPDEVTSENTGYEVLSSIVSGPMTVYGVSAGSKDVCIVGLLAEAAPT